MKIKRVTIFYALIAFTLIIVDVEAGWKFWKKDKTSTTTTTEATLNGGASTVTPTVTTGKPVVTPAGKPNNLGSAVIGAGDPGLAIGVTSTGQSIRNNARPNKPNPGTEAFLDLPNPKPGKAGTGGNTGQNYREWAADLTGAGEPGNQPGKLPSQGPALNPTGTLPAANKPTPPVATPVVTAKPQTSGSTPRPGNAASQQSQIPGGKPGSLATPVSSPIPAPRPQTQSQPQPQPGAAPVPRPGSPVSLQPGTGGQQTSTLNVGPLKPTGSSTTPAPSRPASPDAPGRTWADVAGGGGGSSRPNSPTSTVVGQPSYPGQPGGASPQPSRPQPSRPQPSRPQPGQNRPASSAGTLATGALAGGALVGAAAAGGSANPSANKVYSSNPTYSKGNTITDEDLEKLSEALFIKDNNNANKHITLNLQKQTSSSSTADEASQPLFTVNSEAFQGPTIQRVISIYDNYQPETNVNEHISPLQRQEESLLVDTFLSTNVMSAAMRFLADKERLRKDYYEYKDTLRKIWFNLFSRGQGKIGSSGFEHVFMAELKKIDTGTEVVGLHNWIYYSKEEAAGGKVDYNGYLKKVDLGDKASIVKIRSKYNGIDKPVTTLFVGTSPELEMALYTVCFYARPDGNCPVSLGGTKFNIVTHKFKYRGNDLVGTAYPEI